MVAIPGHIRTTDGVTQVTYGDVSGHPTLAKDQTQPEATALEGRSKKQGLRSQHGRWHALSLPRVSRGPGCQAPPMGEAKGNTGSLQRLHRRLTEDSNVAEEARGRQAVRLRVCSLDAVPASPLLPGPWAEVPGWALMRPEAQHTDLWWEAETQR